MIQWENLLDSQGLTRGRPVFDCSKNTASLGWWGAFLKKTNLCDMIIFGVVLFNEIFEMYSLVYLGELIVRPRFLCIHIYIHDTDTIRMMVRSK